MPFPDEIMIIFTYLEDLVYCMQHNLPFSGETGLTVEVMSWGATMTKMVTEDGVDILLGFDDFKGKEVFQQRVP